MRPFFRPTGMLLSYVLASTLALIALFCFPALYLFGSEPAHPVDSVQVHDATKQLDEIELEKRLARQEFNRTLHLVVFISDAPLPQDPEPLLRHYAVQNQQSTWLDDGLPHGWRQGQSIFVLAPDFSQLSIVEAVDLRSIASPPHRVYGAFDEAHMTGRYEEGIERAVSEYAAVVDESAWGSYFARSASLFVTMAGGAWFLWLGYQRARSSLALRKAWQCFHHSHALVDEWKAQCAYAEAAGEDTTQMREDLVLYLARYDVYHDALEEFGQLGLLESFTRLACEQAETLWWQGLALIDVERNQQKELRLPLYSGLRMRRLKARHRELGISQ